MKFTIFAALIAGAAITGSYLPANRVYYVAEAKVVEPLVEVEVPWELQRIGDCESGDGTPGSSRQFYEDGSVVVGKFTNPAFGRDVGRYQINTFHHLKRATELGFDLYSEEGNEGYALVLYQEQGSRPWGWSKHCHGVE